MATAVSDRPRRSLRRTLARVASPTGRPDPRQHRVSRPLAVVLPQGVQDRQRRPPDPPADPAGDLVQVTPGDRQPPGVADDVRRRVGRRRSIVGGWATGGVDEPLDAGEEEPDPPLAVGEGEPPGRQPPPPPPLDGLAGDVEPGRHVVNGQDRLGHVGRPQVQAVADLLDQQTQVVLQRQPGQQVGGPPVERGGVGRVGVPVRLVMGDVVDDEVDRVRFGRVQLVEQPFGRRDLLPPRLGRRERHLPGETGDRCCPVLSHDTYYAVAGGGGASGKLGVGSRRLTNAQSEPPPSAPGSARAHRMSTPVHPPRHGLTHGLGQILLPQRTFAARRQDFNHEGTKTRRSEKAHAAHSQLFPPPSDLRAFVVKIGRGNAIVRCST